MKKILILMLVSITTFAAHAQLSLYKFPLNLSIVPRDLVTNEAHIEFEGLSSSKNLVLKKFRNGIPQPSIFFSIDSVISTTPCAYKFKYTDTIQAAFVNYRYELWQDTVMLHMADSICGGDVYIINGQSNAESRPNIEKANYLKNGFIRTYGNASESPCAKKWFIGTADGTRDTAGHIGQLGIAIATKLIEEHSFPICIMNGAVGGMPINYFLRDDANHQNINTAYGRLLQRMDESNLTAHVRAIVWFQGEKDAGIGTTHNMYLSNLETLYNSWHQDYPSVENVYLYQIRYGCWQAWVYTVPIQQAQFDFALAHPDVFIISTDNVDQYIDSCHYEFEHGYKVLGNYAAAQMKHYQYGHSNTNGIRSLLPKQIHQINDFQIELILDNPVNVIVEPGAQKDFFLKKNNEKPILIESNQNHLIFTFQNLISGDNQMSFLGHSGIKFPAVKDENGNGLINFDGLSDTSFDWHLVYQDAPIDSIKSHYNHLPIIMADTAQPHYNQYVMTPLIPSVPCYTFQDGFYFYPASHDLIVESNQTEVFQMNIDFYSLAGNKLFSYNQPVNWGSNRYHLPIERGTFYILRITVKGKNAVAYKQLKMMY